MVRLFLALLQATTHTHTHFCLFFLNALSCLAAIVAESRFYSIQLQLLTNVSFFYCCCCLLACLLSILVHIHTSNIERIPKYLFFLLILLLLLHVDEKTIEQEEMKNKNKNKKISKDENREIYVSVRQCVSEVKNDGFTSSAGAYECASSLIFYFYFLRFFIDFRLGHSKIYIWFGAKPQPPPLKSKASQDEINRWLKRSI